MAPETHETLSNELQLALAHTAPNMRDALRIFFELDSRFARIVAGTNEVMLGQMRLTWWRDVLKQEINERPQGDAVLDGIGQHWRGFESGLEGLVDGWEWMLTEEFDANSASKFAHGRCKPVGALVQMAGGDAETAEADEQAAMLWALADAATNISDAAEREILLGLAREQESTSAKFPKPLRGLAVLVALARRSIARGGRPLMEGRGAALVALRAAIIGR